jgi:hypothetical protein
MQWYSKQNYMQNFTIEAVEDEKFRHRWCDLQILRDDALRRDSRRVAQ